MGKEKVAKIKFEDYDFIDLTKTDLTKLTDEEKEVYIKDTCDILNAYKKKIRKGKMLFSLLGGLIYLRGGLLEKISIIPAVPVINKYKLGNCTKEERKLFKKCISTFRKFLLFRVFLNMAKSYANQDSAEPAFLVLNETVAKKKATAPAKQEAPVEGNE